MEKYTQDSILYWSIGTLHAMLFVICLSIIQYFGNQVPTDDDVDGLEIKMDDAVANQVAHSMDYSK